MLNHLFIKNYALIEKLEIDFHKGFSVITGETGAGKSIILGALGLLLGERADSKSLKPGTSKCVIEATYDISSFQLKDFFEENELEYEPEECIIRRELSENGKSRAFINDSPVSLSILKSLGSQLVDIHSQHQNLLLNDKKFQLKVLDTVAQNEGLITEYVESFKQYTEASRKLDDFQNNLKNRQENNDYIVFQLNEIDNAHLQDGEQEELEEEAQILDNAGDIKEALYKADTLLSQDPQGIIEKLSDCYRTIDSLTSILPKTSALAERLDSCSIELDDIQNEISQLLYHVNFDPERQAYVNERLDTINSLESKYHKENIAKLLEYANTLRTQVEMLADSDETLREMKEEKERLHKQSLKLAQALSESRKKAIPEVEKGIIERLQALGMPNIRFEIKNEEQSLSTSGIDVITFLFSANKEMPLQDLATIGSGGEIARVMLALKAILSTGTQMRTLIFDEIDTGVSGRIAEKMAYSMKDICMNGNQVISITHLPQIAALGEYHYLVYKEDSGDATLSHIRQLSNEERIQEIAHMLSGSNITEAAMSNAKALLNIN